MDNDSKFWLGAIALVVALLATVLLTGAWNSVNHDNRVAEMVKAGADPLAVRCASEDGGVNSHACLVLAAQRSAPRVSRSN